MRVFVVVAVAVEGVSVTAEEDSVKGGGGEVLAEPPPPPPHRLKRPPMYDAGVDVTAGPADAAVSPVEVDVGVVTWTTGGGGGGRGWMTPDGDGCGGCRTVISWTSARVSSPSMGITVLFGDAEEDAILFEIFYYVVLLVLAGSEAASEKGEANLVIGTTAALRRCCC